ncbi:GlsB/YeaQ/YmgE family stress response membrane protein [Dyella sp. 20L07]|uniref:GlsB/YeaQ/YmgE family stress response membrane protein n=1 Tax=Dyella sp. 20L07 TaxID=3384240 RepID=UPI003D27A7B0
MHWLWVFIVGLVVGVIAKALTPGKEAMGFIITAILGIAGSFLSTYIGEKLGLWGETGVVHFLGSVGGAVILLVIYHLLFRRGATS